MSSWLKRKPRKKGSTPGSDLAATLEVIAKRIEDARENVERELVTAARVFRDQEERVRVQLGGALPPHSALDTTARDRDLLGAPTAASRGLRTIAASFRKLDELFPAGDAAPSLPSVRVAKKAPRGRERTDVERSLIALVEWLRRHEPIEWDKGDAPALMVARCLVGTHLHDEGKEFADKPSTREEFEKTYVEWTSKKVAVYRAIDDLVAGLDSEQTRAIRDLAHVAFGMAAALRELAARIEKENPKVTGQRAARREGPCVHAARRPPGGRGSSVTRALARLVVALREVADCLEQIDETIRSRYLTAPYEKAPRGSHGEHVLFLAAIKHLDLGQFTEKEIAVLIFDGRDGTTKGREKRIRDGLDRDKGRDRRTRYVRRLR